MRKTQYCTRFPREMEEEILRLAKVNAVTPSEMIRALVLDGIVVRAESSTNSQFQYVERRLHRIENRFAAWLIKISKSSAQTWFFVEQLALFEVDEDDRRALKQAADDFMRQFLQQKTAKHLKDDQEHLTED